MTALRPQPHPLRRALAGLLAFLIGFGPLTPLAQAADTPLADGPINVNIKAKPNIVFTLDDSTSMNLNFLPDYVVVNTLTNATTAYCRTTNNMGACGNAGSATIPQYHFAEWLDDGTMPAANRPKGAGVTFPWPAAYGNTPTGPAPVMAAAFNAMFYNPNVTYTAPLKYDGTSYPDQNAANTTNFTRVQVDPYLFPTKYVNLQLKVSVGVWCNTTYAGNFTAPTGAAIRPQRRSRSAATIAASTAIRTRSGATARRRSRATTTTRSRSVATLDPAGPANFFAQTQRIIYCDPNKRNVTWTLGSNTTATAASCQACTKSCNLPDTIVPDPANPPGCDLGCTNPAECTMCGTKCSGPLTFPASCNPAKVCTWAAARRRAASSRRPASAPARPGRCA